LRKIAPELYDAIIEAGKDYDDFNFAIEHKLWRPVMTCAAKPFVDVTEQPENKGTLVELIQKTVDGKASGEPYCCAFIQTIIAFTEKALNMYSPVKASEHVLTMWNETSPHLKTTRYPLPGYIAVWQHGNTSSGHAGIVLRVTDTYFKTIEANSFGPDGKTQGIFTHERLFNDSGSMKLLGFVSPF